MQSPSQGLDRVRNAPAQMKVEQRASRAQSKESSGPSRSQYADWTMAAVTDVARSTPTDDVDRNLALLAYGLLFFAVFFAGLPALIAVAIACAKRREVQSFIAGHHRFQIFIFWVGFAMTLLAALSAFAGMAWMMGQVVLAAVHSRWNGWDSVVLPPIRVDAMT